MSEDLSKKVLLSIDQNLDEANQSLQSFVQKSKDAAKALKETRAAVAAAKLEQAAYAIELAKGKAAQQDTKNEIEKVRLATLKANQAQKEAKQAVQAASGSYQEAAQRLAALGKQIKAAENGFASTTPEIRRQIEEYNKLNAQLKSFDAKMGNYQRSVGNYQSALHGLNGVIGQIVPGFAQLSSVLSSATQSFNMMKAGSSEAAEGAEGLGVGAGIATAGILGIIAAIAAVIAYMKQLAPVTNYMAQQWAGLKAAAYSVAESIRAGDWAHMAENSNKAAEAARKLTAELQKLGYAKQVSDSESKAEDAQINLLMLKMRDRATSAKEAAKLWQQIVDLSARQQKRTSELAVQNYDTVIQQIANGTRLTDDAIAKLKKMGYTYTSVLEGLKKGGLDFAEAAEEVGAITNGSLQKIIEARNQKIEVDAKAEEQRQRAQNRMDQKREKADREAEKAKNDLIEAQRAAEELVNERKEATAKMLQDQMEAFGKELASTDEHYRQLIFKQEDFIKKQEQLRNKTKSGKAKAQFSRNIVSARGLMTTYTEEQAADAERITTDHYRKMAAIIEKGEDDLAAIRISGIKNQTDHELAQMDEQQLITQQGYRNESEELTIQINQIEAQIKTAKGKEKRTLQEHLDQLFTLQGQMQDKSLQSQRQYEHDRNQVEEQGYKQQRQILDEVAVMQAKFDDRDGSPENDKKLLDAEKQALADKYEMEISQEGLTIAQKTLMHEQYLENVKALDDKYRHSRIQQVVQWEQLVEDSAFQVFEASIRRQQQAEQMNLDRQKNWEMNNTALTSTQKYAVEEKYRKLKGKAEQKAFRQEQELNVAKTIMAGAKAVVEDLGKPWKIAFDIATTAAEVAVIASQKPPAYATGGIHYGNGYVSGPGTGTSDSINARLSDGESVINARSTQMFGAALSWMNQKGGGIAFDKSFGRSAFATGGVVGSYMPTGDNGLRPVMPVSSRLHMDDMMTLGMMFSEAVSSLPSPVVDVKDIANAQQKVTSVFDLGKF